MSEYGHADHRVSPWLVLVGFFGLSSLLLCHMLLPALHSTQLLQFFVPTHHGAFVHVVLPGTLPSPLLINLFSGLSLTAASWPH